MSCFQATARGAFASRRLRLRGGCAMSAPVASKDDRPKYVSAEVIAREYGVPVSQVHRGAREGWLPVMKFGRYSRFDPQRVKAALEEEAVTCQSKGQDKRGSK